ncbi:uncharacterized protein ASCRUDRAFT_72548 [Ascoidea rubescens DSM 1968]|uniref:Uncharacterized protein n=1 Tax=Ascoidea rubescens DSM 1968 TaxID=1344418 RepID=A0A1D2VAH5_9ASCO|nr:hypothetical protein ASCRUDRAFT_72548 [Ascoidea rubescens DSM 1968]ODV58621.1 hypothetical protein ASCRUDRAFT_72548 [Ascoidea rubescens DSM 1968]
MVLALQEQKRKLLDTLPGTLAAESPVALALSVFLRGSASVVLWRCGLQGCGRKRKSQQKGREEENGGKEDEQEDDQGDDLEDGGDASKDALEGAAHKTACALCST